VANRVNYDYDWSGFVSGVTVIPSTPMVLALGRCGAAALGYRLNSAGEVTGWSWASGKTQTVGYDSYGQINSYQLGDATGTDASAGPCAPSAMTAPVASLDTVMPIAGFKVYLDQFFAYDDLSRLTVPAWAARRSSTAMT